jgi:hypothetical protein
MSAIFARANLGIVYPSLTDNTARWAFIAAIGLVSATGLWALGVNIAWESLLPAHAQASHRRTDPRVKTARVQK